MTRLLVVAFLLIIFGVVLWTTEPSVCVSAMTVEAGQQPVTQPTYCE